MALTLGLFATGPVGREIARFVREQGAKVGCLVLDSGEEAASREAIRAEAAIDPTRVFYSDDLYQPGTLDRLRSLRLDLIVLAWWPYILKSPLVEMPSAGCLNFHPSLLPHNRGKHYNFWALVEEAPFGVTLQLIDAGVDTGDVVFQAPIETTWEDTGETLYRKAQAEIVRLFKEKFPDIREGRLPRKPQDLSRGSFHKAHEIDQASKLELGRSYTARQLLNVLRARTFPPHPAAWFEDQGKQYEVRVTITPKIKRD